MDINELLFSLVNGAAGRSFLFDSLVSMIQANHLLKAGVVGACFVAAWHKRGAPIEMQLARKTLLTTLVAALLVMATTKTLSRTYLLPRPYVLSQTVYQVEGDRLRELKPVAFRVPLDQESQKRFEELKAGGLTANNQESFPSDHAGFFVCISLGIWLASRRAGTLALAWTFIVILGGKVFTGMHAPVDIAVGGLIAAAWLYCCCYVADLWPGRPLNLLSNWTMKHAALSSSFLFLVVFEISSTMTHVQDALLAGRQILRGWWHGF